MSDYDNVISNLLQKYDTEDAKSSLIRWHNLSQEQADQLFDEYFENNPQD